jgi:hypothetical protein
MTLSRMAKVFIFLAAGLVLFCVAALTAALGIVRAELRRWRNIMAGSPRKRGEWRRR